MKKILKLTILSAVIILSSCVAKKKYTSEVSSHQQCEDKNKQLENKNMVLLNKVSGLEGDTTRYGLSYRGLNMSKNSLEQSANSEKNQLNSELDAKGRQLSAKDQLIRDRERRLADLQAVMAKKDAAMQALRAKIADALVGFTGDDLSVVMKDGKIYVSMQEKLLFKSGSAKVDPKGKDAIAKLSDVLLKNPDIQIMIEGHTDNVPIIKGSQYADNWELSSARALSIIRILTQEQSIDPKRITAAGKSEFNPIEPNTSPEGRAKNRRTEIILSPKLDELYDALSGK